MPSEGSNQLSPTIETRYLKMALRELADAAEITEHSTDDSHWERLYRAIAQARRLCDDE